jgi:hypothetical protein
MTNPLSTECTPDACTLPVAERPLRVAEFDALFRDSLRAIERVDDARMRMRLSGDDTLLPALTDLTARETECCSFFRFTITELGDGVLELEIAVSPPHVDVLHGLTGLAARAAGLRG